MRAYTPKPCRRDITPPLRPCFHIFIGRFIREQMPKGQRELAALTDQKLEKTKSRTREKPGTREDCFPVVDKHVTCTTVDKDTANDMVKTIIDDKREFEVRCARRIEALR